MPGCGLRENQSSTPPRRKRSSGGGELALDKRHSGYTVLKSIPLEPRPSASREGRVAESGAISVPWKVEQTQKGLHDCWHKYADFDYWWCALVRNIFRNCRRGDDIFQDVVFLIASIAVSTRFNRRCVRISSNELASSSADFVAKSNFRAVESFSPRMQ